ncbi:MAG: metallophosphoesterase [Acidobacteria bacterium]|nr:metallophosphoesterase [Acidobacteriota bacterium]
MKRMPALVSVAQGLALALALAAPASFASPDSSRIVAIGDVHGSLDAFVTILESAGLIDGEKRWSGGTAVLVQTGDLMDRGAGVREVLDLIMSLQSQAETAGGKVVALLGNHEVNNLVGYFSHQSTSEATYAKIFGAFADDESQIRRRGAFSLWRSWQRRYPGCVASRSKRDWMAAHPLGYVEYLAALAPDGHYGHWLREQDVVARIGDTIFLHGGLSPDPPAAWPTDSLEAINQQIAGEIERFDADKEFLVEKGVALPFSQLGDLFCAVQIELAIRAAEASPTSLELSRELEEILARLPTADSWLGFNGDGPLWFRGYAQWPDEEGAEAIARVAAAYGAQRFVVGHTPQTKGILARFDDRVFLIDTAMVFGPAAGGRPSALELREGEQIAIYEGSRANLFSLSKVESGAPETGAAAPSKTVWLAPDGEPLPFESPEDVADFLRSADVESVKDIPIGVTQPKWLVLAKGGLRSRAVFRYVAITEQRRRLSTGEFVMYFRDDYINEVAAYELSRLLGMDNLPPAVEREIDGQPGSVQMAVENAMMETDRREKKIEPPDRTRFTRQFYDMKVFDNLINNIDRNSGNFLFDADWKLWLIDHTRSFARGQELPSPQDVLGCSRDLLAGIKALDESVVTERLRPYLSMPEIKALLERRKRLLALIEERIAERGEDRFLFDYGDPSNSVRIVSEEG